MRVNHLFDLLFALAIGCATTTSQKPFDQMSAQEHRDAAAREYDLADRAFENVHPENISPPETLPTGDVYDMVFAEHGGDIPYTYDDRVPDAYIAWPRVSDPSEKYEDAAIKHREIALKHERAAAALEGRPSPQPLPPPTENPLLPPDQG